MRSRAVDWRCLGGLQHSVAPPSIIQPGLRSVAAQRLKAEASNSSRRKETGGAQISVVVAKIPSSQFSVTSGFKHRAFQSGLIRTRAT